MTSKRLLASTGAAVGLALALLAAAPIRAQTGFGPQGREEGPFRRQVWLVPSPLPGVAMHATVWRPAGPGPFPLVVINHGSTQNAMQRAMARLPQFAAASQWFVARGYAVVVPQRPGHGETGGAYLENQKGCDNADYRSAGIATARSIKAAIEFMTERQFVRRDGVIVVGLSAGGWGALALAGDNPRNVKAVINFAGGRGGRIDGEANKNCATERLVDAARDFGSRARLPTLWIYAQNDSYFDPALSKRMADAFRIAGGRVAYHLLPPFGADGHTLLASERGPAVWGPVVEKFLAPLR